MDVVGVVTPLRGGAQVLHDDRVVELRVSSSGYSSEWRKKKEKTGKNK